MINGRVETAEREARRHMIAAKKAAEDLQAAQQRQTVAEGATALTAVTLRR